MGLALHPDKNPGCTDDADSNFKQWTAVCEAGDSDANQYPDDSYPPPPPSTAQQEPEMGDGSISHPNSILQ